MNARPTSSGRDETGVTRLAPSPTGALHLGNARTFLVNWALARQRGWRVVLRMEDLDGPRVKPEATQQAIDVMRWLGLDWDRGPLVQSDDLTPYRDAMQDLMQRGEVYPCRCTRKEIERAMSAPHGDEHELRYPGTCRPAARVAFRASGFEPAQGAEALGESDGQTAWRLMVPDHPIRFDDALHGPQAIHVQQQVGDFVVYAKRGQPAYQLAVVVDDARQGVTDVVRGDDLLRSTARQVLLYDRLGLGDPPRYYHVPLVLGEDGRRLAKRHGDTRLLRYRDEGVPAERVIAWLARSCGIAEAGDRMTAGEFAERFRLDALPREPVSWRDEDEAWLTDSHSRAGSASG